MLPEQLLTITARLLPCAAHHIYATGSMRPASVSTILVSTRILVSRRGRSIACLSNSPFAQAAAGFPAGNRSVPSSPGSIPRSWGRGCRRASKVELFPCMHIAFAISRHRPAALAVRRVPRGELCGVRQPPAEATLEAPNRPPAVNHCRGVQHAHVGGPRTARTGASHRHQASSTARIDGHSRIGVRLSCGDFSNLRVFE
jgi:hypothetical protein